MQQLSAKDRHLRILYLEDDSGDAELFHWNLTKLGRLHSIVRTASVDQFRKAFEKGEFDLIVSDSGVLGCNVLQILDSVRQRLPQIPFIVFSGNASPQLRQRALEHGATEVVSKDNFPHLIETIQRVSPQADCS